MRICSPHEELRSSFIFIIAVSVLGRAAVTRDRWRSSRSSLNALVRAALYKHLNIYETFIGAARRIAAAVPGGYRFRTFRITFDYGQFGRYRHQRRPRRRGSRRRWASSSSRFVAYNVFPFTRYANVYYSATRRAHARTVLYFYAISPLYGDEARKRAALSLSFFLDVSLACPAFCFSSALSLVDLFVSIALPASLSFAE